MTDSEADAGENGRRIPVEMTREEWNVVLHVLEEELAQLVPPEGDWIGEYPGEDSVVAVEGAHTEIARSLDSADGRDGGGHD